MFHKVPALIGRMDVELIEFKLKNSRVDVGFGICRGDEATFDDARVVFNWGINEDVRKGNYEFETLLKPSVAEQRYEEVAEADGEDTDVEFA